MAVLHTAQRVLVADDDRGMRELLRHFLMVTGYGVDLCENGRAALERLVSESYSFLILDYLMPPRTGLEVIKELRAKGNNVPVILMSGTFNRDVLEICLRTESVTEISKPFGLEELRRVIDMVAPKTM